MVSSKSNTNTFKKLGEFGIFIFDLGYIIFEFRKNLLCIFTVLFVSRLSYNIMYIINLHNIKVQFYNSNY